MQKTVDSLFASCAEEPPVTSAPASLRSRIYSAVVREAEQSVPLRPLTATVQAGYAICDWEKLMKHMRNGEVKNHCTVCPARVVAETFDRISMPWPGCPYRKLHSK
jgi:hypothetical protein